MRLASKGAPGSAGRGCDGDVFLHLLVAMGRAIRSRLALFARPASPALGLDWMAPARQGLAKRVRQKYRAACKHFYAASRCF
jgi:hypothetical protein